MARVTIEFYREADGVVPFLDWFASLPGKAQNKCRTRLERLEEMGHELRRPEADYLRDGIYELRIKYQRLNYRILYFFHGQDIIVLSQELRKERAVPPNEIDLAVDRKARYVSDPEVYGPAEELP